MCIYVNALMRLTFDRVFRKCDIFSPREFRVGVLAVFFILSEAQFLNYGSQFLWLCGILFRIFGYICVFSALLCPDFREQLLRAAGYKVDEGL